jgi:hypothetical protein
MQLIYSLDINYLRQPSLNLLHRYVEQTGISIRVKIIQYEKIKLAFHKEIRNHANLNIQN